MNKLRIFHPFIVKGRIILTRDQRVFSYVEVVLKAVVDHFKRLDMQEVQQIADDLISFKGGQGKFEFARNDFELKKNLVSGEIKISLESSELVAHYRVVFYSRFALKFLLPMFLVTLLVLSRENSRTAALLIIGGALLTFLIFFLLIIRLGMKRELPRAFKSAENAIEFLINQYDTTAVEPEHRDFNPNDMLRSAYYFKRDGLREKASAYYAYLLEKYPWSDEAIVALEELRSLGR